MNVCADCGEKGVWIFNDPGALPVVYCEHCLPLWLRPRAINGTLTRAPQPEDTESEPKPATKSAARKKTSSRDQDR